METLTTPASVTKRKQACQSCRQRKKRCDGERPCSLCRKWGIKCDFSVAHPNAETFLANLGHRSYDNGSGFIELGALAGAGEALVFPSTSFDLSGPTDIPIDVRQHDYPTPTSAFNASAPDTCLDLNFDSTLAPALPSDDVILELVDLFLVQFYDMLPCFHKSSLINHVRSKYLQDKAPMLLYIICAMAAFFHPDPAVKDLQSDWYEQAKFQYELTPRDPHPALQTLQTSLCLHVHSCATGDFSPVWLGLGKSWRQACCLSLNRMDSGNSDSFKLGQEPASILEKEEHRRVLWLLFMLDREISWPTGWPHAIDDRQFKIDIPIHDEAFQAMTPDTVSAPIKSTPFTRNLDKLVVTGSAAAAPLNILHYLTIAHVIFGRISEQIHSLHDSHEDPEYAEECEKFDNLIIRFRLSLPRVATSVLECPEKVRPYVIWLNCILNTMAILVHYRVADVADKAGAGEQFAHAVIAAKNTAKIVRETSRLSTDLLLTGHIASSLYIAATVLIIQWRITGDDSLRSDIELMGLVFDRLFEVLPFFGLKFKVAFLHTLQRSPESLFSLRERGFKGLLADCSQWGYVRDYILEYGMALPQELPSYLVTQEDSRVQAVGST
ncbi:hypothetical protein EJ04DRAFT_176395 [Polyplosphaeria fusca]|uniref:Zn(2)-C6 fungal-type domain-containing protein n=1 Tax=Polyplosphaeria fusca TaxID=682080 RepID=A0A9P4QJD4_9PLEO|nr:hypothetical protein EJ04DRAFT_176395 [Polyplosphaeria fusca]